MTNISGSNTVSDGYNKPYTPTTEEVRADYCLLADVSRPRQMQFDRWLAEVKAQAVKEYQEKHWAEFNKSLALDPYRQGETR